MSSNSRRFLIGVAGAIVLAFVIAGVAILAYNAGREAAGSEAQTPVITVEDGSVTIEEGGVTVEAEPATGEAEEDAGNEPATALPETPTATAETAEVGTGDSVEEDAGDGQETTEDASETPETESEEEPDADSSAEPTPTQETVEPVDEGPRVPVELDAADIELLLEVWDIIDARFDGQLPDQDDVTYRAIAGSLQLLDDEHTRFITPEMAERLQIQLEGSFEGIGAFVEVDEEGYLVIVRPMEGQPAARAGLLEGDRISHVNGRSIVGWSVDEMTAEIKGPAGTDVTLTVLRETLDEPFDVTVTRERIEIPIVAGEMLEDNIAYVRLSGFSANAAEQLEAELQGLLDQDPSGLILDLRDNPGGFLSQAVSVSDLFLGDGIVLYERDGADLEQVFRSDDGDLAESIPLVVLVNSVSASASEILAGAVQDRGRGVLVGETTFGKGSVQAPYTLSDGSVLRVTIARWYTPDNRSIDAAGIVPDFEVETPEVFGSEEDTQLFRAIRYLVEGR